MTALRIFHTSRPSLIGAPVLPMSKVDEETNARWAVKAKARLAQERRS